MAKKKTERKIKFEPDFDLEIEFDPDPILEASIDSPPKEELN
jgi:hypothetical protein